MSIVILERETGTFRPSRRDEARGLKVLNYDGLSSLSYIFLRLE